MPKTKPHIFVLLAFLLLVGIIIPPISAASYTLTGYQEFNVLDVKKDEFTNVYNLTFDKSVDDQAITLIHFKAQQGYPVNFIIYYGAGSSASGSVINYNNLSLFPPTSTTSSITFDGVTKQYNYLDTNPSWDYYLSGYARNNDDNTTGLIVYNAGYGSFDNDLAVFKVMPNIAVNLIYRVDLSSDAPFDVDITYGSKSDVASSVSKSMLDIAWEWINFAIGLSVTVFGFVLLLAGLIKFFFIDNLLLVIALWFGVTMAYSAISTGGNIFKFYTKFLRYQRTLLGFMVELWNYLIQIISSFRGIFRI